MKGVTTFELTNVKTGEVERIEDHNMFTNALDSIFNRAPYYFNNALLQKFNQVSEELLTPPNEKALGGLLLFPEPIAESADVLYAPAENKPTGIASHDAYSGADSRRGSFNAIESGPVTNGYRFVWDFTTSQANGPISCACLTSAKGGEGYLDGSSVFLHSRAISSVAAIVGLYHKNEGNATDADTDKNPRGIAIGADDDGVYFYRYATSSICRYSAPKSELDLVLNSETYETLFTLTNPTCSWTVADGFVWGIKTNGNSSGNASIVIDKYDKSNGWSVSTQTVSVAAQLKKSENTRSVAILGGYLYLQGYDNLSVYKINLSNFADVTKIATPTDGRNLGTIGHLVACKDFVIEADDAVHSINALSNPLALVGCWAIMGQGFYSTGAQLYFGATILTPYLATINNLSGVIQKTADKTMKVTYTVYRS